MASTSAPAGETAETSAGASHAHSTGESVSAHVVMSAYAAHMEVRTHMNMMTPHVISETPEQASGNKRQNQQYNDN